MSAIPHASPGRKADGPPSGTVTFAFTDIEGSTSRWERYPAAMQAAVRRHDALLRAAIGAAGGHVFKTIGDAFCAAFMQPEAAAAAMIDALDASESAPQEPQRRFTDSERGALATALKIYGEHDIELNDVDERAFADTLRAMLAEESESGEQ